MLLFPQRRYVRVATRALLALGGTLQPRRYERGGGLAIGKGPDYARVPADFIARLYMSLLVLILLWRSRLPSGRYLAVKVYGRLCVAQRWASGHALHY